MTDISSLLGIIALLGFLGFLGGIGLVVVAASQAPGARHRMALFGLIGVCCSASSTRASDRRATQVVWSSTPLTGDAPNKRGARTSSSHSYGSSSLSDHAANTHPAR
jgi:hypothetical protein